MCCYSTLRIKTIGIIKRFNVFPFRLPRKTDMERYVSLNFIQLFTYLSIHPFSPPYVKHLCPVLLFRKIEIVQFASRTRQLFVRLLALVKWASNAGKVEKCAVCCVLFDFANVFFL